MASRGFYETEELKTDPTADTGVNVTETTPIQKGFLHTGEEKGGDCYRGNCFSRTTTLGMNWGDEEKNRSCLNMAS